MKSYFMHYSCVVTVLFNTALYRSAFPMVSFRKLPLLSLSKDFRICIIMLCNFNMWFCSHFLLIVMYRL